MIIKEPQHPVNDIKEKQQLENELRVEINNGHLLYNKNVSAIIRRYDCDDVVYQLSDNSYALVHLTWSGKIESNSKFPSTSIYKTLADIYNNPDE